MVETDTGGLEDEVVIVKPLVIVVSFHNGEVRVVEIVRLERLAAVGHREGHVRKVLANEAVGGDTLTSEAEDNDVPVLDFLDNVVGMHTV